MDDLRTVAERVLRPRAKMSCHEVPIYLGHEPRRETDDDVRLARAVLAILDTLHGEQPREGEVPK